jgi:hypothetical protein
MQKLVLPSDQISLWNIGLLRDSLQSSPVEHLNRKSITLRMISSFSSLAYLRYGPLTPFLEYFLMG